jgi:Delta7-sterol 5-desaturase
MAQLKFIACLAYTTGFFLACTAVGLGVGYALERYTRRRVWALPLPKGQFAHELRGNVVFLALVISACSVVWWSGWVNLATQTSREVLTFFAFLFAFQAYYYALHRLLHTPSLVRFHRWHHESRVTTPLSGQSVSAVEAVGWAISYAGLPVAMSQVSALGFWGIVAYLAFNVIGNIVGHANAEVVPPSKLLWWRSSVATVFTYHALHHARWTGHYGFASTWADRLFKTEWPDWLALHKRVWSGKPMTSFKERG